MRMFLAAAVAFTVCQPSSLAAQTYAIDKGAVALAGTISWSSSGGELYENAEGDRYKSLLVNPNVMYFVAPGLALGGEVYIESAAQGEFESTTIAVGPSAAYFLGGPDSRIYPFIAGFVGYAKTSASEIDGSGVSFGLSGGAVFMLSQSVGILADVTYRLQNVSYDQLDESFSGNTIGFALGVQASIF